MLRFSKKILPTITTTRGSDWKTKIEEVNKLKLKEVAVFLTCLEKKERKELYKLLEKSKISSIPFLHLRSDMSLEELDYFVKNYKTKVFNTHPQKEYPLIYDWTKYKNIIYIENVYHFPDEKELKNFAGICLDFTHLENDRLLNKKKFENNKSLIEKYPIGCNHISAIKKTIHIDKENNKRYDSHYLENLSELNYLKKYPLNYFSRFIAIELENSIKEQLIIKAHLINLIK